MFEFVSTIDGKPVRLELQTYEHLVTDMPDGISPFVTVDRQVILTIGSTEVVLDEAMARQLVHDLASELAEDDDVAEAVWRAVGGR